MRATRQVSFWLEAVLVLITSAAASAQITIPITEQQVVYELIGEFNNSGLASQQYGYLSSVTGLDNAFSSTITKNETTALFTFVTDATTFQVVNHGPFRIVDRTGTTTIYLNSGPSDFSDPSSFSQGTPIQVSSYRQQVIINTLTNTFVTVHTNNITSVETFTLNGAAYRLGQVGKSFRTNYSGRHWLPRPIVAQSWKGNVSPRIDPDIPRRWRACRIELDLGCVTGLACAPHLAGCRWRSSLSQSERFKRSSGGNHHREAHQVLGGVRSEICRAGGSM